MDKSKITFIVKNGANINQTVGSILYDKWGSPTGIDLRCIEHWSDVHSLKKTKDYLFFLRAGTVLVDIDAFMAEITPVLIKTGIGHIIYKKDDHTVRLNDQALLIRKEMLNKSFGHTVTLNFPNFIRSDKDIHHDYTPLSIKRKDGETKIEKSQFGQDVIADHLRKFKYFNNFPNKTRKYKVFLGNPDAGDPFKDYNKMITNTLWIFNNEKIIVRPTDKVLCTGGGIGWMLQICSHIEICDISKIQIKFIKNLLEKWNGKNFGLFVYNFIKSNNITHYHLNLNETQQIDKKLITDPKKFVDTINQNLQKLVAKYRKIEIEELWIQLQNKKIIVSEKSILERVSGFHLDEINLSNVFDFKYNYITNEVDKWQNLLSPATKSFIKSCQQPRVNPYRDPPCRKLSWNVPINEVLDEIDKIKHLLVPHRENSGIGWTSFCIHGKSFDATREDSVYQDNRLHKWTDEAKRYMPKTIEWLKSLDYKNFKRVRVMCLLPRGFINVHRDRDTSKLGPVNVAINHPEGCKFYLEHYGELQFRPGSAYEMNLVNHHAVVNASNTPRYHIIIHGDR